MPIPVILIFDVGKTNKKLLLFDRQYRLVYEEYGQMAETEDEDGFPCENLAALTGWMQQSVRKIQDDKQYDIRAANVAAYGASFVHLNRKRQPFLPLYNYLKPYDPALQAQFYEQYGGEERMAAETASPVLGHLNSGLQLYWLKHRKPEAFAQIAVSLHLPQYLSFVLCGSLHSDLTSIGCHTALWDFARGGYHRWVHEEGITGKLPPLLACDRIAGYMPGGVPAGGGLHDSSAALIPYSATSGEDFILLSTGTWNISLNPFNHSELTPDELAHDCLSYLSYRGVPVKASRLFAGYRHAQQVKTIAAHYHLSNDFYKSIRYRASLCGSLIKDPMPVAQHAPAITGVPEPGGEDLCRFQTPEEAYHRLLAGIVQEQVKSIDWVRQGKPVKRLFVDGGFSKNEIFMNLLAAALPQVEVYAAAIAQASALGAAIAIRSSWNEGRLPPDLIALQRYYPADDCAD